MNLSYWQRQDAGSPLFPDIEWNKPEQKTRAGKLAIIGGNKLGFRSVASSYDEATYLGAGQIRAILPDALKRSLPVTILDTVYVTSNPSGGMSKDGLQEFIAACGWADHILLIGDTGRNSETAMLFEQLLECDTPMTITRDAVDLLRNASQKMVDRDRTTLVLSFSQLQKLFQAIYFPKILSFSMTLQSLVETLHKFTISYPATIVTFHQNRLVIAHQGKVISSEFDDPMMIWRGSTATRIACYQLWTPNKPLEASATAVAN